MKKILIALSSCMLLLSAGCGGGGGGQSCGPENLCAAGEYCNYDIGACGVSGSCEQISTEDCSVEPPAQVCTCDKLSFVNECYAAAAGQSIAGAGDCP